MKTRPNASTDLLIVPAAMAFEHERDVQRAGGAVHHRQPVERKPLASAEDEVPYRAASVDAMVMVAAQRDERVQRQRHQPRPR